MVERFRVIMAFLSQLLSEDRLKPIVGYWEVSIYNRIDIPIELLDTYEDNKFEREYLLLVQNFALFEKVEQMSSTLLSDGQLMRKFYEDSIVEYEKCSLVYVDVWMMLVVD